MAIAFDAATDGGAITGVSPYTVTHTCTGSNRILFVAILFSDFGDIITGVTYNGVSMTRIRRDQLTGTGVFGSLYYMVAPATGANTVSIAWSGGGSITAQGMAVSYTGAAQTGQPDASTSNTAVLATSITTTLTTSADNCWAILHCLNNVGTIGAGSGVGAIRLNSGGMSVSDTNAVIHPAGSDSMTITGSLANFMTQMASFSPVAGASLTPGTASVSTIGLTTATVVATAPTGGTSPYTYQWKRSTTSGSGYSNVSGATSLTLNDTGLTRGTTYYYECFQTDSAGSPATVNTTEISLTTKVNELVASGNSQTAGAGGTSWATQIAPVIGSTWQINNTAVGGQTTQAIIAAYTTQIGQYYDVLNTINLVVIQEVMNDIYFNATAQQAHDNLKTICLLAKATGFNVMVLLSQPDRGDFSGFGVGPFTSTLPGATGADQQAEYQSRWAAFLALFEADWYTYCDGFVYPNQDVQIVITDPTYISAADEVHWTTVTQTIVMNMVAGDIASTLNPNPNQSGGGSAVLYNPGMAGGVDG